MDSSTLEDVTGQFEDAESDDDASPALLFSKTFAAASLSPPKVAPPGKKTKKVSGQIPSSSAAASAPLPVPVSETLRQVDCPWPVRPRRVPAETARGTGQPRLVGGPTELVCWGPHSRGSTWPMIALQGQMIRAPEGPGAALPDQSSWSPFYKPIAPHGTLDETMSARAAAGCLSPWITNDVSTFLMHPGQPRNVTYASPSVLVLASGEAGGERIEVEKIDFPEVAAGAPSFSEASIPDSASRKASIKQVVLGLGSGVGSKQRSRPSAVVDAAHAMTELSRQSPASVPPSISCLSPAMYLQMTHPHPSIAPRVPSLSIGDHSQAHPLLCRAVESDFEAKKRPIVTLGERDIILGRGGQANHHPGNIWFRSVIQRYRMHYCVLVKGDKMQMARNLANWFYLAGARFLMHSDNGCWYEAGTDRASKKCSQSLREGACAVVRKTLEGSILVGTEASLAGAGPANGGCHSNTVTPTFQIEQAGAVRSSTATSESQKSTSTSTSVSTPVGTRGGHVQNQSREGKRDAGIHRERNGTKSVPPKRPIEGGSCPTATNWESWRKRARESTS